MLSWPPTVRIFLCSEPTAANRFVGSNAPGQLFYADESVTVNLALAKGAHTGKTAFKIDIQEIGTRTPGNVTTWHDGAAITPIHADASTTPSSSPSSAVHSFTVGLR